MGDAGLEPATPQRVELVIVQLKWFQGNNLENTMDRVAHPVAQKAPLASIPSNKRGEVCQVVCFWIKRSISAGVTRNKPLCLTALSSFAATSRFTCRSDTCKTSA